MKNMPDPLLEAKHQAERINKDRHYYLVASVERIIADAPWVKKEDIISGVLNYYREAISKVPSLTKFPEAKEWVDYVIRRDRYLMELANLTEQQIAILRSMGDYLTFRGYREFGILRKKENSYEKCRVAFLPETDMGPMHIKNVDDPITYWKPEGPLPAKAHISKAFWYGKEFVMDGVGSGLHIDDEPEEIFPLPVREMVYMYAQDTFSALEFLRRYFCFWGGANILIYDKKLNGVAIEKCSRNFFEVYQPDEKPVFTHISGMVCRDSNSPQAKYQKQKRDFYRELFDLPEDGPDELFWKTCDNLEKMLVEGIKNSGEKPQAKRIIELFTSPYPSGLRKDGLKLHPQQGLTGYTLITSCAFLEKKLYYRWQRKAADEGGIWPDEPEICHYET